MARFALGLSYTLIITLAVGCGSGTLLQTTRLLGRRKGLRLTAVHHRLPR